MKLKKGLICFSTILDSHTTVVCGTFQQTQGITVVSEFVVDGFLFLVLVAAVVYLKGLQRLWFLDGRLLRRLI